jgi:ATPase subunit of ABC transporter with duplicated ATPase domains
MPHKRIKLSWMKKTKPSRSPLRSKPSNWKYPEVSYHLSYNLVWCNQLTIGALVCVVGRVGTGKSALLLGMINEMRQTHGHTLFGGTVSYGEYR